jgi:hypothetical protein
MRERYDGLAIMELNHMNGYAARLLMIALLIAAHPAISQTTAVARNDTPGGPPLERRYKEGEAFVYHMTATNQGHMSTIRYEADAKATVAKNAAGHFVEEFQWTGLNFNGQTMPLSSDAASVRQNLSLDQAAPPSLPDFSRMNPMLIGPSADLMTFYADLWLAIRLGTLTRAGDHAYFKRGTPNSWADGTNTLIGQDSIDFDLTLSEVNPGKTAKLIVRHVPPVEPQIKVPTKWMEPTVADTANNWVEVSHTAKGDHPYLAEIGKETFDVEISVSLENGRILSATMDNPVTVMARECVDAELKNCGTPERYQIRRQIEIHLVP